MKLIEQRRLGGLFFLYTIGLNLSTNASHGLKDYMPQAYGFLKTCVSNDEVRWLLDEDNLVAAGTKAMTEFYTRPHQSNIFFTLFDHICLRYKEFCIELNKKRMSQLSTSEIASKIDESFKLYQGLWDVGCAAEFFDFALPSLLKTELNRQNVPKKEQPHIIATLSTSEDESFSRQAENSIISIAYEIKKRNLPMSSAFQDQHVLNLMQEHLNNYYWTSCNYWVFSGLGMDNLKALVTSYCTQKESPESLFKKINYEKIQLAKEKDQLISKYALDARTVFYFSIAQRTSRLLDERKKAQMYGFYAVGRYLKELAQRINIDFDLAKYLFPHEVSDFAHGKISVDALHKRRQYCFIEYEFSPPRIFIGDAAKQAEDKIWEHVSIATPEVGGVCASPGIVTAYARVISSARQLGEIKSGEILVTGMTSPEYVPALKKVVGIITDDGGITSHAAIISRELKVPAIVGTKLATRKIKTGDLVELRAHHGIARIVKKTFEK